VDLDALIDQRAAEVLEEIREACQIARLELGLPLLVYLRRGRHVDLPARFACPECGSRLVAEISEWEDHGGRPIRDGVEVHCLAWLREEDDEHRFRFSDWYPIQSRAAGLVRRRARIVA
jgi:hypothetical protein